MKLYGKNGVVIAWHEDVQVVPASAYGEGVTIASHAGRLGDLERVGPEPDEGEPDNRPFAMPDA